MGRQVSVLVAFTIVASAVAVAGSLYGRAVATQVRTAFVNRGLL
jgi:hypothetical protein